MDRGFIQLSIINGISPHLLPRGESRFKENQGVLYGLIYKFLGRQQKE